MTLKTLQVEDFTTDICVLVVSHFDVNVTY